MEGAMYVVVRFGDKEEGIFNPNCRCITFLMNIRDRCGGEEAEVEVSDESGNVKNLRECPYRYANEFLTDRERLVLLKVERRDTGDTQFIPMLNDTDSINETFLAQLASRAGLGDHPGSRRARTPSRRTQPSSRGPSRPTGKETRETPTKGSSQKSTSSSNQARAKSRIK